MAEVSWIKIDVDLFENRKIKYLRRLPHGNDMALIWIMLLTIAGRCNNRGMVYLTEKLPYTPAMLADELGFDEDTVTDALAQIERLGMIAISESGMITIRSWEEHQNIDGMDKIREQNRKRQKEYYDRKKSEPNVSLTLDLTQPNATDKIRIDKNIKNNISDISSEKSENAAGGFSDVWTERVIEAIRSGDHFRLDRAVHVANALHENIDKDRVKKETGVTL